MLKDEPSFVLSIQLHLAYASLVVDALLNHSWQRLNPAKTI
ncbi:hypothetical protein [Enterobacter cloacae]